MNHPVKVLVFAGSTRAGSWNRQLAAAAARIARADGAEVTELHLGDLTLPLYDGDLEAQAVPPDVIRLKELLYTHEAWLIATPEYNGSYPPVLKNAIDWASRPVPHHPEWRDGRRPFAGKVAGIVSASPGAMGGIRAQSHLLPLLMNLGTWVAPRQFALIKADEGFDPDGQLGQETNRAGLRAVVEQVLWAAARLGVRHAAP